MKRSCSPCLNNFHYRFVSRYRMELETAPPAEVWELHVAPSLDAYIGKWVFEGIVPQAYSRLRGANGLPLVAEWGRNSPKKVRNQGFKGEPKLASD